MVAITSSLQALQMGLVSSCVGLKLLDGMEIMALRIL